MKHKVFSVYDSKVQAYARPFLQRSVGEALRGWITIANDPQHDIGKYPGDFSLMEIASFDDETGYFEVPEAFINHGTALEFKDEKPAQQRVAPVVRQEQKGELQ